MEGMGMAWPWHGEWARHRHGVGMDGLFCYCMHELGRRGLRQACWCLWIHRHAAQACAASHMPPLLACPYKPVHHNCPRRRTSRSTCCFTAARSTPRKTSTGGRLSLLAIQPSWQLVVIVMPCQRRAMPVVALHCGSMPCPAMASHARYRTFLAMPCRAMACHARSSDAMHMLQHPCHAMPCHAHACHAMPCHADPFRGSFPTGRHPPILLSFTAECRFQSITPTQTQSREATQ